MTAPSGGPCSGSSRPTATARCRPSRWRRRPGPASPRPTRSSIPTSWPPPTWPSARPRRPRPPTGTAAPGPLAGVPVSIKDAFHVEGHVTTLGSLAHTGDVARYDSGAVRRLRRAGAVFVGKTNIPEFCQSATTDNLLGPDTANPFDPGRTAGGSSGGAAASVASGTCTLGLGSDGGGSIRIPAAFCGLVGLKPTYGTVHDAGGFRAFSPFISAGPLARCVADARHMLSVLAPDGAATRGTPPGTGPSRVAWCPDPEGRPVDPRLAGVVASAVQELAAGGHHVSRVELDLGGWGGDIRAAGAGGGGRAPGPPAPRSPPADDLPGAIPESGRATRPGDHPARPARPSRSTGPGWTGSSATTT